MGMQEIIEKAKEIGFDVAVPIDPSTLEARKDVRDMCEEDKCHAYAKNWTCPPECGTLEECQERMKGYRSGVLLQTIGRMSKDIDRKVMMGAGIEHMKHLYALADYARENLPECLPLGAGGCRICEKCAYPEPCRFPDKAMSSMEGYGLFVTDVCRKNEVPYYYGPRTLTYTACILFNE